MTERALLSKWIKLVKSHKASLLPIYIYKDKDTYGGHKKPCDVWVVYLGLAVCIEFKAAGGSLSEYQVAELKAISEAGARCFVGVFDGNYIEFRPIDGDRAFLISWQQMKYPDKVSKLLENLIR